MLKREIKYTDFDGNETSDVFHFHISKHEIVELEVGKPEGMEEFLKNLVKINDRRTMIAEFKRIILLAYGEKSPDGKTFVKSDEISLAFSHTAAFDALFIELATDDTAIAEFIRGVLPADVRGEYDKAVLPPPPNTQPVGNPVIIDTPPEV